MTREGRGGVGCKARGGVGKQPMLRIGAFFKHMKGQNSVAPHTQIWELGHA